MGLIKVSDHTAQCYSNDDGKIIYDIIATNFKKNVKVKLSFEGISSVTSSFVNSAFIDLLEDFSFSFIKDRLSFTNTNRQINSLINQRFKFEVNQRKNLVNA